jgi:hypothetical protein
MIPKTMNSSITDSGTPNIHIIIIRVIAPVPRGAAATSHGGGANRRAAVDWYSAASMPRFIKTKHHSYSFIYASFIRQHINCQTPGR